jgi:NitT/TauT family transport system substrate-binding protein
VLPALSLPAPAAADDTLSVIYGAAPQLFDALDLVAIGADFFKDEHLNVERDHVASASLCAQLVATGKADVCSMSVEPVLQGYEKGVRLQFFLARAVSYSYLLAVLDDSPIRTLADFKGADLGEINAGSTAELSANSMLSGAGLKMTDYSYIPVGNGPAGLDALLNKRVAGLAFGYSEITTYEVIGHVKFRLFRDPILKDIANVGYAATPATIATKGDLLQRYSRAIAKAALFIRENPAAAARLYLELQVGGGRVTPGALETTTQSLTLLKDYLPAADPSNPRIGYLSPRGLELYSRYLVDAGMAHQVVPGSAVVTDQFIGFANDFDHRAVTALAKGMK